MNINRNIPDKKRNATVRFSVKFSFFCQNANCHKMLSFDQISPKLECGIDEYLCFPCVGTKHIKANGKWALEVFIQWYCLHGIPSMLCNGNVRKRYGFVM